MVSMLLLGHKKKFFVFFYELSCAIIDINVDYMLVCGEFNCVLKNYLDIISGEKHIERVALKFNDLLSDCDLYDTWRLFHPEGKEGTWCNRNPFVARRLDYILTNSMCFDKTIECNIHSVASTDHRGCSVLVKFAEIERGPGYWKFNN